MTSYYQSHLTATKPQIRDVIRKLKYEPFEGGSGAIYWIDKFEAAKFRLAQHRSIKGQRWTWIENEDGVRVSPYTYNMPSNDAVWLRFFANLDKIGG